ncbi:MAG: hypothetical protein B0D92_05705 [Spirochaeta sp. LUC14_002_19_P3]|nr:MAG: hypothetical protein B0D92_05705 [Spirochaeta sp. LUC14_002_19_P3]
MSKKLAGFVLIFAVVVGMVYAETWSFSAAQVTSVQRDDISQTVLEGNVQVNSEKLDIKADYVELTGKDYELLKGNGRIYLRETEKGITITSNSFDYDKNAELLKFRGFVTLMDEKDEIVIRCESLDYYEAKELVILQAAVRLIKDKTVGRGEFATYRRTDKILELSGRPVVWQDKDKYQADRITVNLDSDEISMEGAVKGTLTTEEDEDIPKDEQQPDAVKEPVQAAEGPLEEETEQTEQPWTK